MRTLRLRALAVSALVAAAVAIAPSASAAPYDGGVCTFDVTRTGNVFTVGAGTCDWVLLEVYGSLFYAGARTLSSMLPAVGDADRALVIIRLRGLSDVGSTLLGVLEKYATNLHERDGELMITGVDASVKDRMLAASQFGVIRADYIFASTHVRHQSIAAAERAAARPAGPAPTTSTSVCTYRWSYSASSSRGSSTPMPCR